MTTNDDKFRAEKFEESLPESSTPEKVEKEGMIRFNDEEAFIIQMVMDKYKVDQAGALTKLIEFGARFIELNT